jgi:LacI family transcriptional regulator
LGSYGYSSEVIRDRVNQAAEALGYRPNRLARGLITGKTQTIGVVAGDISSDFYASAMRGIADVARAAGFGAILTNSDESLDLEREAVQLLLEKQVDGLIVSPCDLVESPHLLAALTAQCRVVQIDRVVGGLPADSVTVDNRAAAKDCVSRLFSAGHTSIAFVAELESSGFGDVAQFVAAVTAGDVDPQSLYPSWQRLLGYLEAHQDSGIEPDMDLVIRVGAYSVGAAKSAVLDLLNRDPARRPTALFTGDGKMSTGAMAAISSLGLTVPDDLSLVCFDDLDWMSFVGDGITTVVQPVHQMGTMAAELLLSRIAGDDSEFRHLVLPAQIAERGSIGPARTPVLGRPTEPR